MRKSGTSLFIITILLVACGKQAIAPVMQPQSATLPVVAPATSLNTPVNTAIFTPSATPNSTITPSETPFPTFTPTSPPPVIIGLENFNQLVTLHDYARDIEAVIQVKSREYGIFSPVYSPDSKQFAVPIALPNKQRIILILDVVTGDLVQSIPLGESVSQIYSLNFTPDGQKLIYSTGSTGDTGSVSIWDLAAHKIDRIIWSEKGSSAYDTSFSPDGKQIVAMTGSTSLGGRSRSFIVWDAVTGKQLKNFPADAQYGVDYAMFSASGNRLILSTGKGGSQLTVYETSTWQVLTRISPPNSSAEVVTISPDGTYVLTSRQVGGHILLWEASTGKLVSALDTPFESTSSMEFSPDGSMLIVTGAPPFKPQTDNLYLDAAIWDTATWKQIGFQYWGSIQSLQFSPDSKSLLADTGDNLFLIGLPDQDIKAADQAVLDFSKAMSNGDYAAAVQLFSMGGLDTNYLNSHNLISDPVAILETICKKNAFPCLPATVIYTTIIPGDSRGTVDYYDALVRFTKTDGSIYADSNGATIFDLAIDQAADGSYQIDLFTVDYEKVLKK
jgi:WD40 repeat protein